MTLLVLALLVALAAGLLPPRREMRWVAATRGGARVGASTPDEASDVADAAAALGLLAAVLRGGGGPVESLEAVASVDPGPAGRELAVVAAAHRWGVPAELAWQHVGPGWSAAAAAWHAAHAAGAAPAALLEEAARRMLDVESRRVEAAVQRAGVLLVLPLGLCFLPGFVATTVAPVVLLLLGEGAR
ncbi:type II secretion system F family protein [Phycicoccus duodecadis]|uniref:Type II secretion system (T2SS) protein F n=1 Tax=Phycicoccus duodecadis TaxID=173053 RepID=A0A2N3YI27_9MICO|nr:type II secretion system F family protein [Phycicoccus duodecadis]PKW26512.1 type II secretion system (T2SS) protein F [Phycicoccus duodecadis]